MPVATHKVINDAVMRDTLSKHMCMLELSLDGTIANANENFLHSSHYSLSDVMGKSFRMLCTADFLTTNQYAKLWEQLRNGSMVKGMFPLLNNDGNIFWLAAQYFPLLNAEGKLNCVIMYGMDETDTAATTLETQGKLAAIDRSMLLAECSPSGTLITANENYLSAFGSSEDEMLGKHLSDLFSEKALLDGIFNQVWEYVSSGHTYSGQVEMRTSVGESLWLQSVYAPIFGTSGKLAKIAHFAIDISWSVLNQQNERAGCDDVSLIVNQAGSGIVLADRGHKVVYVNPAFTEMFGYEESDIKGKSPTCVFGPEELRLLTQLRDALQTSETLNCEEIVYGKNGLRHYTALVAKPVLDQAGVHRWTIFTFTDITYTKMSEALQRKTLSALSHDISLREVLKVICLEAERVIPEVMVCIMCMDGNDRLYPLAGPSIPRCIFEELANLTDESATKTAVRTSKYATISNTRMLSSWNKAKRTLDDIDLKACSATPILSSEGKVLGTVTFCYLHGNQPSLFHKNIADVLAKLSCLTFELDKTRSAMRQMTFYDPVTSLPNRSLLITKVNQLFLSNQIRKAASPMAVMNINIDRFKRINDSLGFGAGNILLDIVAKRLASRCKSSDLIGRLAGDEFALLLTDCDAEKAADTAARLQNAISIPCTIGGEEIIATISIGISQYPENGGDMETLLAKANLAMDMARKTCRNNSYGFFSEQESRQPHTTTSLESHLYRAIQDNGLSLHYQPQIRFDDGSFYGAEALARWNHPELGMVSPAVFIPLAEESGMIEELSDWVVREVARQVRDWRDRRIPASHVSLNLSAVNFHDSDLPQRMLTYLGAQGLGPADVVIELTESALLDENPTTMTTIQKARDLGFCLALDDFGTGYSSLSYLRKLPVDIIKLDQVFVRDLNTDETSRKLSRAIMHLCRELGLTMVVEGVENREQYDLLKSQGYHILQGFYISRPLHAPDFENWLTQLPPAG